MVVAPPPQLDIFTAKVMALITGFVVSLAAFLAWRVNRRVPGMKAFTFGLLAICGGGVLGFARLIIPGNLIIIACNVVMVGGMVSAAQGIRSFRGFPRLPRGLLIPLCSAVGLAYLYSIYVHDVFALRVGWISTIFGLLALDAGVSMFRNVSVGQRLIFWPTACAFGFTALYSAARAFGAFTGHYGTDFLSPVPLELATSICGNASFILCAFGMVLVSNTQLRHDAERMAQRDPLTNLPNRRLFVERLQEAETRARTSGLKFGLIYLDLDGFKQVNDLLGHDVGDDLLRNVSNAMLRMLRATDCLGRIGGDEFVALVEGVREAREVSILAERLRLAAEGERTHGERDLATRVSCGIAVFPDDGASGHDVMREADAAMYRSKRVGRKGQKLSVLPESTSVKSKLSH